MANVQKEKGYTMIANEILEALARYNFPPKTSLPSRLTLFVIRQTYGYHKKEDVISISQFQQACNEKNRTNLIYWLNYLVQAQILVKTKISNFRTKWQFNKDYDQWLPLVQVRLLVQARTWSSASTDTKISASTSTHKRKKEIYTKETLAETSSASKQIIKSSPIGKEKPLKSTIPQSCEEFVTECDTQKKRRDIEIIGWYADITEPNYTTKGQWSAFIKRNLRSAQLLMPFTNDQIEIAYRNLRNSDWYKKGGKFTLETIVKYLIK